MKGIIICCDGTWNSPDSKDDGLPCPTNVIKMSQTISPIGKDEVHQIVYYHDGVGTGDLLDTVNGGAFGVGLSKNIEDVYRFLVNNYVEGDELWFFGFSRGAYTVRSLIGLIRNSGLLKKEHSGKFSIAYELYKERSKDTHPDSSVSSAFKNEFCFQPAVHFLGVWDTVGSLGVPDFILAKIFGDLWNFHDVQLSSSVKNAYQALAIDERRGDFQPCLWTAPQNVNQEQVWFAGVHADIGGGYPVTDLSDIALVWMMQKAQQCGLSFISDKILEQHNACGVLHDSYSGFFKLRPEHVRQIDANAKIHQSVQIRLDTPSVSYKPANLTITAANQFVSY
ncbi:MAG: DUF2235 domain-containing protein [Methylococcaceae bacterium]